MTADRETKGEEMFLPFLLQGSEVLLKGRADLAQQLHQRMAQEAGIGWFRIEGIGSRSGIHTSTFFIIACYFGFFFFYNKYLSH